MISQIVLSARWARDWFYGDEVLQARLDQLRIMCLRLGPPPAGSVQEAVVARINGYERAAISLVALCDFEILLVPFLPDEDLKSWVTRLRLELKREATAELYDAYVKAGPPDPKSAAKADVEADAVYLLQELRRLRIGNMRLEQVRAYFTIATLALAVAAIVPTLLVLAGTIKVVPVPLLVPIAGMFGAFFSLMGRLYSIPSKGDLLDRASGGWRKTVWVLVPFVSAAQGMIAAYIVYMLMVAGLSEASKVLFPSFVQTGPAFPPNPDGPQSAARLLVWSFVAGFAERLVPDTLGQLASRANAQESRPR